MATPQSNPHRREVIIEISGRPEPPQVPFAHRAFGARAKLQQAFNHMRELHDVTAMLAKHTHVRVEFADNPATGYREWTLHDVNVPPTIDAGLLAGDLIHNLRSALDHLTWQLVLANGSTPTKQTSFPIAQSAANYRDMRAQRLAGASAEAKRRIDALEPYGHGAGAALWELHDLDVQDKHKLLLPTVSAATAVVVNALDGFPPEAREMIAEPVELVVNNAEMIPAADGVVVLRAPLGVTQLDNTRIRLQVTLGDAPLGDRLVRYIDAVSATYTSLVELLD